MPRKYPFYPAWDGGGPSPVTEWFAHAMNRRWKFRNLGIYANRPMNNPAANGALSTHATGFAVDLGYTDRRIAVTAWNWLLENSATLRICEIHDYVYRNPRQDPKDKRVYGRGYRCSRGEGTRGVKIYDKTSNAGFGGAWLHVEVDNTWTLDGFQAAWRSIPKP